MALFIVRYEYYNNIFLNVFERDYKIACFDYSYNQKFCDKVTILKQSDEFEISLTLPI